MPQTNADRNMLIGVLALQMDFIDRDRLVEAMRAWIAEKHRPLDHILLEQQSLDEDTRALLVALVDKHFEKHGGNAQQSLAAVSSLGSARQALKLIDDESLHASLVHVAEQARSEDPNKTNTYASAGEFTSTGLRFRVLRPHAAGGLGKISVAKDEELAREVALKEIKGKYADDPASRSRFMLEAEVTGGLEHPGIVPVYGLGTYADGRPFYAMRFIRGDSLERTIERYYKREKGELGPGQRRLELRKLLGRLVDVCYAIEYAHNRGVLHRDLKPGNIMLGKYGETLVVDWGLAKTADEATPSTLEEPTLRPASARDSEGTQEGSQLGTPAYMSPEQAAGRLDLLAPVSDVYSLGATLYELLAGQVSVSPAKSSDWADRVQKGDFPKPSAIRADVPRALEAICLRTMAIDPSERYQSAAALAEDIENWLGDEPVTAWKEPLGVRAGRWLRRHRTIASSTAAAVLVGFAIATVALVVISRQKAELAAAYTELESTNLRLAAANAELAITNVQLEEALDKQVKYLALARKAVDEMLTQVGKESLKNIPQMEGVRKKLLTEAREFYRTFSEETPEDPRLRMEVAVAWRRIADVQRIEHDAVQAEDGYRKSIKQLEVLVEENKDQAFYQRELALSHRGLGLLFLQDRLDEAVASFDEAIRIASDSGVPSWERDLANFYYNRGITFNERGDQINAIRDYSEAIEILLKLAKSTDAEVAIECRHELGRCYNNKARALSQRTLSSGSDSRITNLRDTRTFYQMAVQEGEEVLKVREKGREVMLDVGRWNNSLANTLGKLANALKKLPVEQHDGEQPEELLALAQTYNARAVELFEELAAPLPDYGNELGNARNSYGALLIDDKRLDDAERELRRAEADFRTLARFHANSQYLDRLSMVLYQLGLVAFERKEFGEARRAFEEAIDESLVALEGKPNEPEYFRHISEAYNGLRYAAKELGGHEVVESYARKLVESSPENPDRWFLAAKMFGRCVEIVSEDGTIERPSREQLTKRYSAEAMSLLQTTLVLQADDAEPVLTAETLENEVQKDRAFFYLSEQEDFETLQSTLAQ